jgi:hypothetical protein
MDILLREKYNKKFRQEKFDRFIDDMNKITGNRLDFKVSETPLFLDEELTLELIKAGDEILKTIQSKEFINNSTKALPQELIVPNEDEHPIFLQIDFGIASDQNGKLIPQLIELQGFPSLYAYQAFLEKKVREHFEIPENLTAYYNNLNYDSYVELFKETLLGDCDPENVILLEIEPERQKTRIDFFLTEHYIGIKTVCVTEILKRGKKLFYKKGADEIQIKRIYNRVIFDELLRKDLNLNFSFSDDLDITWVGHPNWFYKISKFSLPQIKSRYSPDCYYLSDLQSYPEDLENYVLKPLFSFAGSGVIIDINKETLDTITDKSNYILQKKVNYIPLIQTPEGKAKAEIRMMYIWNDKPMLVNNLLRTSKGKMMGVDFNKNQTWIGSNTIFHPQF